MYVKRPKLYVFATFLGGEVKDATQNASLPPLEGGRLNFLPFFQMFLKFFQKVSETCLIMLWECPEGPNGYLLTWNKNPRLNKNPPSIKGIFEILKKSF